MLFRSETAKAPIDAMLTESRSTIEAARAMSSELTGTIQAFDSLMKRFEPKPSTAPVATAPGTSNDKSAPAGKPFDIQEYGDAATRIGGAAKELRETLTELDRSLPQVTKTVDQAVTRVEAVVDSAFQRGMQLGIIWMATAGFLVLLVRWVTRRMTAR